MPFDFSDERDFNDRDDFDRSNLGADFEQSNPESFRACLRYLQEEALRSGFLFPGHLIGVAAEAMDCFVEDLKTSERSEKTSSATGHA